jgi:2-polyprenyl-6-methoxyphenol hydroxylase-like FAD-dependent oxidoreductase
MKSPECPGANDLDVLVVGAGLTGLALAAQLHWFGVRFRIVERSLDRAHESRALAVQARTLELFDVLDLAGPLVARGNTGTRVAALKDPPGANLDRVQVVKGWMDKAGALHEPG